MIIATVSEDILLSGQYVADALMKTFPMPRSVIEISTTPGQWCSAFFERGATLVEVLCEKPPEPFDIVVSPECYSELPSDLSDFGDRQPSDLAICINALRALRGKDETITAPRLVEGISSLANTIIFCEPAPHIQSTEENDHMWPSAWVSLFSRHGFSLHDVIRPRLWGNNRIDWQWRQNMLLFVRSSAVQDPGIPETEHPVDIVHPENYRDACRQYEKDVFGADFMRAQDIERDLILWSTYCTNAEHKEMCQSWIHQIEQNGIDEVFLACAGGINSLAPYLLNTLPRHGIEISGYFDYLEDELSEHFSSLETYHRRNLTAAPLLNAKAIFIASPGYAANIIQTLKQVIDLDTVRVIGASLEQPSVK